MSTAQITEWKEALQALKQNLTGTSSEREFTIREIIGETAWAPLERTIRHRLGKYVRSNLDQFGLVFARMAGRIIVYRKSAM